MKDWVKPGGGEDRIVARLTEEIASARRSPPRHSRRIEDMTQRSKLGTASAPSAYGSSTSTKRASRQTKSLQIDAFANAQPRRRRSFASCPRYSKGPGNRAFCYPIRDRTTKSLPTFAFGRSDCASSWAESVFQPPAAVHTGSASTQTPTAPKSSQPAPAPLEQLLTPTATRPAPTRPAPTPQSTPSRLSHRQAEAPRPMPTKRPARRTATDT
jgi:hypothetical protein